MSPGEQPGARLGQQKNSVAAIIVIDDPRGSLVRIMQGQIVNTAPGLAPPGIEFNEQWEFDNDHDRIFQLSKA
jgi:hypothetical protein